MTTPQPPTPPPTLPMSQVEARAPLAVMKEKASLGARARQLWIGFWWWFYMPVDCVDLKTGLPDYQRIVPIWIGLIFTVKLMREAGWPPVMVAMMFIAGMISPGMFNRFLARGAWQSQSADVKVDAKITQEITQRRAEGGDFEPS